MNKKLLELLNSINSKKEEVIALTNEGKIEEAKAAKEELKNLQSQFELLRDVLDPEGNGTTPAPEGTKPVTNEEDSTKAFANAARKGFKNAMSEGSNEDGGYTVPEDIQTRINKRREAKASLMDLVDRETVTTKSGRRTYKKRSQQTGFSKVAEGGKIAAAATPKFETMEYEVSKYAGAFPITNELLADSDANITETLVEWIGDESRVTRNKIILDTLAAKEKTPITSVDDIKKILNVTLGQAFKPTSRIVTNDDGLQWLDTLKDSDGDYLLQPNPTDPMKMRLCAGATTVPVEVIPNADMPTAESKIPMIIGDLHEAVKFFDRNKTSIVSSNTATIGELNAFEQDLTLWRAIEREDCKMKDEAAVVYGEIAVAA